LWGIKLPWAFLYSMRIIWLSIFNIICFSFVKKCQS
jgi:hypothetical protein